MALDRITEPELMLDVAQAEAYAAADFSSSDQAVLRRLIALFGAATCLKPDAQLVDLGCGPGNITFLLAERFPQARLLGLDGSAAMLAIAARRAAAIGQPAGLTFLHCNLPCSKQQLGFWAGSCDLLVSNSLLHHLHDPLVLWHSLHQLARPGARIYIKDLRRPPSRQALDALVALHAADAAVVLRRDYRNSLQAAFTPEEVQAQLGQCGLSQLQVQPCGDRYLEVWGQAPGRFS